MDLNKLRNEIDEIDRKIVELIERRYEIAIGVAKYKEKNNIPIYNEAREKEVIEKNLKYIENKEFVNEVKKTFINIMELSKDIQKRVIGSKNNLNVKEAKIIGFQGSEGSFSHEALLKYFKNYEEIKKYPSFEEVFKAINKREIEYGIVPIDNSSTGEITDTYDLIRKYGLYIVGEIAIKIEQNLLGLPGAKLEDIKEIYSHPQGFQQSRDFLDEHKEIKLVSFPNTALSAQYIKEQNDKSKAAIASLRAKEEYGLEIIVPSINSNKNNYTRFVIVGENFEKNSENNKISIVLSTPHKTGGLYKFIKKFADNNLNMVSIKSRPIQDRPWEYFFYIDFEGNIEDENVQDTLEYFEKESGYFKFLGNYKKDDNIL
ncbi:MAG: bifunctional chorismate mutase/prephenate dehydratase [Fusobacteriales bacterium]|jgi:chorismate mutase/prephenate dehydratase|nr:bifunctional chorismate mutase/prephenate dehydratase [Fusobacteriales bacterium]